VHQPAVAGIEGFVEVEDQVPIHDGYAEDVIICMLDTIVFV